MESECYYQDWDITIKGFCHHVCSHKFHKRKRMKEDMIVNKETEDVDRTYGTFAEDKKQTGDAFPPLRVSYDDVLEEIGEFGRWQQWQSFVYSVPPFMSGALFMLGTFTSRRVT